MARVAAGRSRRRGWIVGIAVVAVAGLATASGVLVADRASAADPVRTATARTADVTRTVTGSGTLVDELTYSIGADGTATLVQRAGATVGGASAPSAGAVPATRSVDVAAGDRVDRGERIARVEPQAGGVRDVDSPVTGRVRSVVTAPHATAATLVTIGTGRVLAALTISENRIAQVRTGQPVAVTLADDASATTGVVDAVEQVPDDSSGVLRYTVLVRLDRIPAGARIGMSATGAITTARADDVVAVPAAAIEVHGDALRVQVEAGGATTTVPVRIGLVGDSAVEVTSGLRAGQRVVTGADGEVAASTSRLGPPAAVTGSSPSAAPSASSGSTAGTR